MGDMIRMISRIRVYKLVTITITVKKKNWSRRLQPTRLYKVYLSAYCAQTLLFFLLSIYAPPRLVDLSHNSLGRTRESGPSCCQVY